MGRINLDNLGGPSIITRVLEEEYGRVRVTEKECLTIQAEIGLMCL